MIDVIVSWAIALVMIGTTALVVYNRTIGRIVGFTWAAIGSFYHAIWTIIKLAIGLAITGWLIYMLFSSSIAIAIVVGAALVAFAIWKK